MNKDYTTVYLVAIASLALLVNDATFHICTRRSLPWKLIRGIGRCSTRPVWAGEYLRWKRCHAPAKVYPIIVDGGCNIAVHRRRMWNERANLLLWPLVEPVRQCNRTQNTQVVVQKVCREWRNALRSADILCHRQYGLNERLTHLWASRGSGCLPRGVVLNVNLAQAKRYTTWRVDITP